MLNTLEQDQHFRERRRFLGTIASIALGVGAVAAGGSSHAGAQRGGPRILIAYSTRTGNTRVIADKVRLALGADVFAIEPAAPYPEDYEATVRQAKRESDSAHRPPLAATVANIRAYETVFLGFPIWGAKEVFDQP